MIDFKKSFLYCALALTIFLLWSAWVKEKIPETVQQETTGMMNAVAIQNQNASTKPSSASINDVNPPIKNEINAVVNPWDIPNNRLITVKTDLMELKIDRLKGAVVQAKLLDYTQSTDNKQPLDLLNYQANHYYIADNGIVENGELSNIKFNASKNFYEMSRNEKTFTIKLDGTSSQGLKVQKQYIFEPGKYYFLVKTLIENQTSNEIKVNLYNEISRQKPEEKKYHFLGAVSYEGAAISSKEGKRYEKITFDKMEKSPSDKSILDGWIAMQQHYFVTAWIPESKNKQQVYTQLKEGIYTIGSMSPTIEVKPKTSITTMNKLYVGPEIAKQLNEAAPHLDLTIDYGWLWFISTAIFWLMEQIHKLIGNWGWSIIIVTILIKLAFYRLSEKSYRSMARMRNLQPKLAQLKERFGDDRARLNQAVIELYKKEKINPFGGCLPMLVQIPVFIGLYWVLLETVQLRQAPFIFWIKDLSVKDPYFVLPILMGISMLIQQKLTPSSPDDLQQKVMLLLPVVFTFLFLYFPSGLVLYWLVNNIISLLQQIYIMRKVAAEPAISHKPYYRKKAK